MAEHVCLEDGLIRPAHGILVQGDGVVQNLFCPGQGLKDIEVILIERMLRERVVLLPQELCPIDQAVDHKLVPDMKPVRLIPGDDPAGRNHAAVGNAKIRFEPIGRIDIIMDDKIGRVFFRKAAQEIQQARQISRIQHVIRIQDFKKRAERIANAEIQGGTMAAIGLMMNPNQTGITGGEPVRNRARLIGGAVIHDQDVHFLPAGQQGRNRLLNIGGGVITGNDAGQQFHHIQPFGAASDAANFILPYFQCFSKETAAMKTGIRMKSPRETGISHENPLLLAFPGL